MLAATLAIWACGGNLGVLVSEYPVGDAGREVADASGDSEWGTSASHTAQYWSARVFLETQDLKRLWRGLKYALIAAKVTIPTQGQPLVRDFPLFTLEDGVVETHAGADLLQKIPILDEARTQTSVTFEITAFSEPESLAIARRVLKETTKLAQPVLANYPVASQILGGATSIIESLVPEDKRKKNSATTLIDSRINDGELKIFLLRPLEELQGDSTYASEVHPCRDKREALCFRASAGGNLTYRTARVDDVVYATLSFTRYEHVYDPFVLLPAGSCELVTPASLASAREYLASNAVLFSPADIRKIQSAHLAAERLLRVRELVAKGATEELVDYLATTGGHYVGARDFRSSTFDEQLTDIDRCLRTKVVVESPGRVAWDFIKIHRNADLAGRNDGGMRACPGAVSPAACRLDMLAYALTNVASSLGVQYSLKDDQVFGARSTSVLVRGAHQEARTLHGEQRADLDTVMKRAGFRCASSDDANKLLSTVSIFCEDCLKQIREKCTGGGVAELVAAARTERREALRAAIKD